MQASDIRIGQDQYSAYELNSFIESGKLIIDDNNNWATANMSMSIESIILGLTMTPIYIDASAEHEWLVIDGRRRLISLNKFISGKFKLEGLEFFPNYEDYYFKDLPNSLKRKILEAIFTVYSINQGVAHDVKLSIIYRIVPDLKNGLPWIIIRSLFNSDRKLVAEQMLKSEEYKRLSSKAKPRDKFEIPLLFIKCYKILHLTKNTIPLLIFTLSEIKELNIANDNIVERWHIFYNENKKALENKNIENAIEEVRHFVTRIKQ